MQASADGVGELTGEGAVAAEAAVTAARDACEALQRQLLDGELKTYAALGSLLGQAERRRADAAEAGRQHFDTFFGTARRRPLAHLRLTWGPAYPLRLGSGMSAVKTLPAGTMRHRFL